MRILLIEDEPGDAELVRKALFKADETYEVHWVSRLGEALADPNLAASDVILADLSLPDSCGLKSVTALRERLPAMPLIVLTSLANDALALEAIDLGAQDYLVKDSIDGALLRQSIRYALQRQHLVIERLKLLQSLKESKELLQRKNRRLAQLYKTAQRFVDNVSHEFRTPLTVIKEYAALIGDGLAGSVNDQQARMLNVVVDRTDDLNTMVDDMLDVSKLEAGMLGVWRRNCCVADVVRHVMPGLTLKAQVHGVTLETDVSPRLPTVYCDREKLGRVIINLTVNGIKFSREPGIVRLWVRDNPAGREVIVGVTDNGPGIDEEQQSAIFERFKQLDTDIRRSTKGFGLGLCIAKELIELNLGAMNLESKIGQGSTFSLTVPWADPVEVAARYLKQLAARPHRSTTVSLLRGEVDEAVDEASCDDVDAFLNCSLRRNDLMFRVGGRRWLLLLPAPEIELDQFLERVEKSRVTANRNRLRGPLPEIRYAIQGSWRADRSPDAIVEQIRCRTVLEETYA